MDRLLFLGQGRGRDGKIKEKQGKEKMMISVGIDLMGRVRSFYICIAGFLDGLDKVSICSTRKKCDDTTEMNHLRDRCESKSADWR